MAKSTKGKSLFGIIGGVFGSGKSVSAQEIKDAQAAVRRDPNSLRKQHKLADIYAKAEQTGKAIDTYLKLADEYIVREFFPQAIAVYKQVLKLNPNAYDVRLKLSEVYNDTGRRSDALSTLQELALRYESTGAVRIAGEVFARMIEIDPDNIPLRIKLAELYLRVSERQSAIYEFEKALRKIGEKEHWSDYIKVGERLLFVDPEHLHTLKMVSRLYLDASDPMKAIVKLQQAFKINRRDPDTLELLAIAFEKLDQPAKTISVLEELGDVYVESDNLDHAQEVYQQLLEHDPGNEHYRSVLQRIDSELPDAPASPTTSQNSIDNLSQASMSSVSSMASAASSPSLELSDADVRKMLSDAEVYLKYNMQDRVMEVIDQVMAVFPDHPKALELRVDVFLGLGQPDLAAKDLIQLAQIVDAYDAQKYIDRVFELEGVSSGLEEEAYQFSIQLKQSGVSHGAIPVMAMPGQLEPGQVAAQDLGTSNPSIELEFDEPSQLDTNPPSMELDMAAPSVITMSPPPGAVTPATPRSVAVASIPSSSPPIATIPTATPVEIGSVDEIEIIDVDDDDIIMLDDDGMDDDIIILDDDEVIEIIEDEPVFPTPPPTLVTPPSQSPQVSVPKPLANLTPPPGMLPAAKAPSSTGNPAVSLPPPPAFAPPPSTTSTQEDPFAQALQRVNPNATIDEEEDDRAYQFLSKPVEVEQASDPYDTAPMSDMETAAARLQALIQAKETDTNTELSPPPPTPSSQAISTAPTPFEQAASELPEGLYNAPSQEFGVDFSEEEPTQERSLSSMLMEAVQEEPTVQRSAYDPPQEDPTIQRSAYNPHQEEPTVERSAFDTSPSFSQEEINVTDSLVLSALNDSAHSEQFEQAFRYTEQEEFGYALEIYRQILTADPNNDVARRGEQESLLALREQAKAKEADEELMLGLDLDSVLGSSSVKERDRAAQDIADFASAVKKQIGSEEGETHFDLGLAYQGMGLYTQAVDAFETCIEGGYRLLDAHKMIGHCHGEQGQLQDALTSYKRALHIPGITTEERLDTLYEIGLACEQSKRYAIALQYFEEVALLDENYRKVKTKMQRIQSML